MKSSIGGMYRYASIGEVYLQIQNMNAVNAFELCLKIKEQSLCFMYFVTKRYHESVTILVY
jgi:hypothetical protein